MVHNLRRWPNLRHLGESLGGAEGLLEAVSFKKPTKGMGTRGSTHNCPEENPTQLWCPHAVCVSCVCVCLVCSTQLSSFG